MQGEGRNSAQTSLPSASSGGSSQGSATDAAQQGDHADAGLPAIPSGKQQRSKWQQMLTPLFGDAQRVSHGASTQLCALCNPIRLC